MKSDSGVASLEKIKAGLEKRLTAISQEATTIKEKYDACIERAQAVRRDIAALQYSIDTISGHQPEHPEDDDTVTALTQILQGPPLTMKELREAVAARGLSPHRVRKALNGLAFMMVGSSRNAKYTLRDSIYLASGRP